MDALDLMARIVAARRTVDLQDARLDEFEGLVTDVRERLDRVVIPEVLRSSPGAYRLAAYALDLVPAGLPAQRATPLDRGAMAALLASVGAAMPDGWSRVPEDHAPQELSLDRLAGLAEGSAAHEEGLYGLNEVAYSPRAAARYQEATRLVQSVRRGLALWPSDSSEPALAIAAVACRPEDRLRRQALFSGGQRAWCRAFALISEAEAALLEGATPPAWPDDLRSEETGDLETATEDNIERSFARGQLLERLEGLTPRRERAVSRLDETDLMEEARAHYDAICAAARGDPARTGTDILRRARVISAARAGDWAHEEVKLTDPEYGWFKARSKVPSALDEREAGARCAVLLLDLIASLLCSARDGEDRGLG